VKSLFDLNGRVVLATGANRGIGLGFLIGCARQCADVVVWDRDQSRQASALSKLKEAGAGRTHSETVDVSDEAAVEAAFASTLAAMGRVDCVFVNAGIMSRASSFPEMTSEMYHELLAVNLHGAFYTLRAAARHMRNRALAGEAGGSIVICGSLSISHGLEGMEHYAGAKGALAAMVKSLAVELGKFGVRANMIAPGFILTGMTNDDPRTEEAIEKMSAITPLGRPGTPEDIEGPAAYLASDASKFHTGDILVIDGGRSAG
jgi:NAD(P)-dependent dehydrogenase (short-subunit alcohol dehydrogenase family)